MITHIVKRDERTVFFDVEMLAGIVFRAVNLDVPENSTDATIRAINKSLKLAHEVGHFIGMIPKAIKTLINKAFDVLPVTITTDQIEHIIERHEDVEEYLEAECLKSIVEDPDYIGQRPDDMGKCKFVTLVKLLKDKTGALFMGIKLNLKERVYQVKTVYKASMSDLAYRLKEWLLRPVTPAAA